MTCKFGNPVLGGALRKTPPVKVRLNELNILIKNGDKNKNLRDQRLLAFVSSSLKIRITHSLEPNS